jgi:hypothetical protein
MKTLLIFLLGALAGAGALHFYHDRNNLPPVTRAAGAPAPTPPMDEAAHRTPPPAAPAPQVVVEPGAPDSDATLGQRARNAATRARDSISEQLARWDLTPEDIKREFAATGRIIRTKSREAGDRIQDARIVSVIKAKYVLDRELSALEINVTSADGYVVLRGSVANAELVGRAVRLALETDGVVQVNSELYTPPDEPAA